MPLVRINLSKSGIRIAGANSIVEVLTEKLARLPAHAPVVLLVHGYKFTPRRRRHTPHRHILSLDPKARDAKAVSWPRHLGIGRMDGSEPLCIAIGWEARGTIWSAYAEAGRVAAHLAILIRMIRARHDGDVCILAHSLGARVALGSLKHLAPGSVRRMVLMSGAEFRDRASSAVATPAGRTAEIVNVTSRENDLFDAMLELFVRPLDMTARAIGHGLRSASPNWIDVQIDSAATRSALAALGFRVPEPARRVCHWSPYLRPGMFALYRALLLEADRAPLDRLRTALPARQSRRWSRLFHPPRLALGLPFLRKTPS